MSDHRARTPNVAGVNDSPSSSVNRVAQFGAEFREQLHDLMVWRRDVRNFQAAALPPGTIEQLIAAANTAPSVGYSQPWRFVSISSDAARTEIRANFTSANADALQDYAGERAKLYASLKLAGLEQAPEHLAVFCDSATQTGSGLGRKTMPEMLSYSVVAAIQNLSLAARAKDIGVGWVSILDPAAVAATARVPEAWHLIAYLCIGYPEATSQRPELERRGWEQVNDAAQKLSRV